MRRAVLALVTLTLLSLPAAARAQEVTTSAAACIVVDEASGQVLLSHNADEPLPMASTTKIMTALLAIEQGDLAAQVTCSDAAFGVPGTSIYLARGETLTLEHMLYGLMLASGNDAATAIAEHVSGSVEAFCAAMTRRAAALGCRDTVFLTPHGLPCEGHHTTARDLALIAREAMKHPFFRRLVSTSRAAIPWEGRSYDRVLNNKNRLLTTYEGATGIKTGYTRAAGRCLVFGAERNGMRIIGVVLNCPDWFDEAARLMDLAFDGWEQATLLCAGERVRCLPAESSGGRTVDAVAAADLTGVVPKGALPTVVVDLPVAVDAPVAAGQKLGTARMMHHGEAIASVDLVAAGSVSRDDLPARLLRVLDAWLLPMP